MTDERGAVSYQLAQPFLREHKRSPMVSRDGLQAWLGDEIAYLENTILTSYGEGTLAAYRSVAQETKGIPDHTALTADRDAALAEVKRLRRALIIGERRLAALSQMAHSASPIHYEVALIRATLAGTSETQAAGNGA